jgi:hypothetical protein
VGKAATILLLFQKVNRKKILDNLAKRTTKEPPEADESNNQPWLSTTLFGGCNRYLKEL